MFLFMTYYFLQRKTGRVGGGQLTDIPNIYIYIDDNNIQLISLR